MNKSLKSAAVLALAIALIGAQGGTMARADCMAEAQTQLAMNECAGQELRAADAELNRIYKKLRETYAGDPVFLEKLKLAQRAWIALRDGELEAKFPSPNKSDYGSIFPLCASQYLSGLTRKRIADLRVWLDGVQEGDACAGSVRISGE